MHYDLMHDRAEGVVSAIPVLWTGRELVEGAAAEARAVDDR